MILTQDTDSIKSVLMEMQNHWNIIDERTILQRGYQPLCTEEVAGNTYDQ